MRASHWLRSNQQRLFIYTSLLVAFILGAVLLLTASSGIAQAASLSGNSVDGFPVILDNHVVFRLKEGVPGVVSAQERANVISKRLADVAHDDEMPLDLIKIDEQENSSIVRAGDTVLFTIRENDAAAFKQSHQALAAQAVTILKTSVQQYREEHSLKRLLLGLVLAVFSTALLLFCIRVLQQLTAKLLIRIRAARLADALDLRIQNFQLLGSESTSYLLSGGIQLTKLVLIGLSLYLYIPFVLSQFPTTKPYGDRILSDIAERENQLLQAFAQYIPNVITLVIIGFLTFYAIGFAKLVITELGRDESYPWFYPEWIQPTI